MRAVFPLPPVGKTASLTTVGYTGLRISRDNFCKSKFGTHLTTRISKINKIRVYEIF
jgi:hypothetical protein